MDYNSLIGELQSERSQAAEDYFGKLNDVRMKQEIDDLEHGAKEQVDEPIASILMAKGIDSKTIGIIRDKAIKDVLRVVATTRKRSCSTS